MFVPPTIWIDKSGCYFFMSAHLVLLVDALGGSGSASGFSSSSSTLGGSGLGSDHGD